MTNDATRAAAEAVPEIKTDAAGPAIPILDLARRLAIASSSYNKAECLASAAKRQRLESSAGISFGFVGEEAGKHFYDEELMARAAISMSKAECLEDAVIQVAEALIHFDLLWDQFPREAETFQIKQDQRAILRLLYSVLDFLDGIAPQKLAETMGLDYANPHQSPWHSTEEVRRQEVPA